MPSGKYQNSSSKWANLPTILPKRCSQEAVGLLRPGAASHSSPPTAGVQETGHSSASSSASVLPPAMGRTQLPKCRICKWCSLLWYLSVPGSFSPGSVHTAEELLLQSLGVTNSADSKYNCTTSPSTALPAGWSPHSSSTLQQTNARSHPKRPLIPEHSTAGVQTS